MTTASAAPPLDNVGSGPVAATRRTGRPRWVRPSVALLLLVTAVLYLWNLGASGYANDFYAMAVQAGTKSWEALFFGSLDPGNVITVDKPPAAMWLMGLSGRIFGFNTWSMLVPEALCGVASVALLYAAVKRLSGPAAGLLAGAALAFTPVAALMFKFNNPDALLVLLEVAGAYCTVRALEKASTKWLLLAGVAIGFGFITKSLAAFLVLPGFALAYLVAAPTSLGKRIAQVVGAGVAVLVSAGWYVAVVALWPTSSRPYIGGSTDNSALELAFGYNGLGRIFGGEGNRGGGTGGGGGGMFGGSTGLTRMFGASFGSEVSWLLPAALIALVAGLWFTRYAARTDRTRAALLLWGGWTLVTGLTFSYMSGTIHPYYTVALAPGIAALVAIGGVELWRGRHNFGARIWLAVMIAATGVWDFILLERNSSWQPWLRYLALVLTALVVLALLFGLDRLRNTGVVLAAGVICAVMLSPVAYTIVTASLGHSGSIPASGPVSASGFGGMGGPGGSGRGGESSTEVISMLKATNTKWSAAANGSMSAASLALNSDTAVIAIGGFNGGDPAPTLEQFKQYVADGDITYYISGGTGGFGGDRGGSGSIASWVEQNYTATTVGGTTVYDLTKPLSRS
ncbi:glycosyltransferase family 39 protein [Amycolatopsis acididurans]|uniref:glycosyltransferase family 39 protein n=1 Tax=Amycolatopsis acididurans TaxID=2724524 RepID=UPI001B326AC3|nr:glycosyltransferase family 39 protein [Amycolatopsis acididurans]